MFMFRNLIVLLCAGCFSGLYGQAWKWNGDEPLNVVWITCEDISPRLSMYGDEVAETPNLNRLAAEGLTYMNCFSVSGVCAPSRSSLATGMYPISMGSNHMRTSSAGRTGEAGVNAYEAVPQHEVRFVSELLRAEGYYASNNSKEDYQFHKTPTAWDESSREAHYRKRREGQKFFAIFNFTTTHESQIWSRADDEIKGVDVSRIRVPAYLPDTPVVRRDLTIFYNNVRQMDEQVGAVLAELEADGLLESTVIFFYSDHGGNLPREKRLMFDSGLHVPLIIRFPDGWEAGRKTERLVSFVDFAPTLLSICGIEPPEWMQGKAFLGDYVEPERRYIYAARDRADEFYDQQRAVRDKRYKYIRNYRLDRPNYLSLYYRHSIPTMHELLEMLAKGELNEAQARWFDPNRAEEELYDTFTDPDEVHNLAGDPAYAETLQRLREENLRFLIEVGDLGMIPEKRLIELFWPNGTQPVTADPVVTVDGRTVSVECATRGASIGYRVWRGSEKPTSWQVYTGPFELPRGMSLEVVAHRIGYKPSGIVSKK